MVLARASRLGLRLLGKAGTQLPGVIALRVDPRFLQRIEPPERVVVVTGTNGKTTVSNLIGDSLRSLGIPYASNAAGSNIAAGLASTLLASTDLLGRTRQRLGVYEVDERASPYILPFLKPETVVVTNLFRDSYARNAHVDYIYDILSRSIPADATLVVNADDPVSFRLAASRPSVAFSIPPQAGEAERRDSRIKDQVYCPNCGHRLHYSFVRYHHIGFVRCERCGFTNPDAECVLVSRDLAEGTMVVRLHGEERTLTLPGQNITDGYNAIAALLALTEIGIADADACRALGGIPVTETRFREYPAGPKRVFSILGKDQNPIAVSRACDFIRAQSEWGTLVVVFDNEVYAALPDAKTVENMAWIYDADFEYLADAPVRLFVLRGHRASELRSRLLFAGISPERIAPLVPAMGDVARAIESATDGPVADSLDTVIVVHGTKNIPAAQRTAEDLAAYLRGEMTA